MKSLMSFSLLILLLACCSNHAGGQSGSELECELGAAGDQYCERVLGEGAVCLPDGTCGYGEPDPEYAADAGPITGESLTFAGLTQIDNITDVHATPFGDGFATLVSSNFGVVEIAADSPQAVTTPSYTFARNPVLSFFDQDGSLLGYEVLAKYTGTGVGFSASGHDLVTLGDGSILAAASYGANADLISEVHSTQKSLTDGVSYTATEALFSHFDSDQSLLGTLHTVGSSAFSHVGVHSVAAHQDGGYSAVLAATGYPPIEASAGVVSLGEASVLPGEGNYAPIVRMDASGVPTLVAQPENMYVASMCTIGDDLVILAQYGNPYAGAEGQPVSVGFDGMAPLFTDTWGGVFVLRLRPDGSILWHKKYRGAILATEQMACTSEEAVVALRRKFQVPDALPEGIYLASLNLSGSNTMERRVAHQDSHSFFWFAEADEHVYVLARAHNYSEQEFLDGIELPIPTHSEEKFGYLLEYSDQLQLKASRLVAVGGEYLSFRDFDVLQSGELMVSLSTEAEQTTIEPDSEDSMDISSVNPRALVLRYERNAFAIP